MTADARQAGVRRDPLASAGQRADDPALGAAAATIVLALEVGATARDPWQRTFEAAHGAHVLANVSSEADARASRGVPASPNGPRRCRRARVAVARRRRRCCSSPRPVATRSVNAPVRTQGSAPRDGGDRARAQLRRRARPRVGGRGSGSRPVELRVVGTAISPSQPRYPRRNPGLAWVDARTLEQVVPDRRTWRWVQAVRLRTPPPAPASRCRQRAAGRSRRGRTSARWRSPRRSRSR